MNSPFVQARSAALARRLVRETDQVDGRVERAFRLCFGRTPDNIELRRSTEFLNQSTIPVAEDGDVEHPVLTSFCQALLSTAEFRNLD